MCGFFCEYSQYLQNKKNTWKWPGKMLLKSIPSNWNHIFFKQLAIKFFIYIVVRTIVHVHPLLYGNRFRSGNMGASWRHIRQCQGNLGNHICFIDGEGSMLLLVNFTWCSTMIVHLQCGLLPVCEILYATGNGSVYFMYFQHLSLLYL